MIFKFVYLFLLLKLFNILNNFNKNLMRFAVTLKIFVK